MMLIKRGAGLTFIVFAIFAGFGTREEVRDIKA